MALFGWLFGKNNDAESLEVKDSIFSEFVSNPKEIEQLNTAAELQKQNVLRRQEREKRREALFAIVRSAIKSADAFKHGYKFKVLSIDSHGKQFIVLIDLSITNVQGEGTRDLLMLEERISLAAREKNINVQAVYWRYFAHSLSRQRTNNTSSAAPRGQHKEKAAAPIPTTPAQTPQPATVKSPKPAIPSVKRLRPAAAKGQTPFDASDTAIMGKPSFLPTVQDTDPEQLSPEEIAAFQKALSSGASKAAAGIAAAGTSVAASAAAKATGKDNNPLLMTGYEDTEQAFDHSDLAALSKTQYGGLD